MRSAVFLAFGLAGLLAIGDAAAQARGERRTEPQARSPSAAPQSAAPQSAAPSLPAPTMPDAPNPPPVLAPSLSLATPAAEPQSAPAPLMGIAPPAPPVIPPPLVVPARPTPPPAAAEVLADAPGQASRIEAGWRITFGPGQSALNPATAEALRSLARAMPAAATITVSAFAPGSTEDPSSSRRLSLARAIAARGVLITEGIASPRIFVRALGAGAPIADGPPDRVDLVVSSPASRPAP